MNTWYYQQGDQSVGPFTWEVLAKLKSTSVIDDGTPVKGADGNWRPFAECDGAKPPPVPNESRFYYLDANRQPVGPFDLATLRRLHVEGVIAANTLITGTGDAAWIPMSQLLGIPPVDHTAVITPRRRTFEHFVKMMGVTLTLYTFYVVPSYSRDMKAITGRPRMEFKPVLILGIVTCGFFLNIMMVLWAYDLEKHGKAMGTAGRRESLGTHVLVLIGITFGLAFFSGGLALFVAIVISCVPVWLLQKEINLYAPV